jgi:hypothetical protein
MGLWALEAHIVGVSLCHPNGLMSHYDSFGHHYLHGLKKKYKIRRTSPKVLIYT